MWQAFFGLTGALAWLASVIARVLLACVFATLLAEVVLRFAFNTSLAWSLEFARFAMIWAVMLASSLLVRDRELIAVDFFDHLWPKRLRAWRDLLYQLFLLAVLSVLGMTGYELAVSSLRQSTPALQISWLWPYLAIPVGASLMGMQMLHRFAAQIQALNERRKH